MENNKYRIVHTTNKNIKRDKGKLNFISIAVLVIIISSAMILFCEKFVFGQTMGISVDALYDKTTVNQPKAIENYKENNDSKKIMSVIVRQYGVFSNEQNAKKFLGTIKFNSKYIIKQNNLYKIMGEIYLSDKYDLVLEKYKCIDSVKTEINLVKDSKSAEYCCEMINGVLQILNKFTIAEVESVETSSLKEWVNNTIIEKELKNDNKYEQVIILKKNILNLPENVKQENLNLLYESIYSFITSF